jgi:RecJ-like exonuclease
MNRHNGQPVIGHDRCTRQVRQAEKPVRPVMQREVNPCPHCKRKMHKVKCTKCFGIGRIDDARCDQCGGFGQMLECLCMKVEMHLLLGTGVAIIKAT